VTKGETNLLFVEFEDQNRTRPRISFQSDFRQITTGFFFDPIQMRHPVLLHPAFYSSATQFEEQLSKKFPASSTPGALLMLFHASSFMTCGNARVGPLSFPP